MAWPSTSSNSPYFDKPGPCAATKSRNLKDISPYSLRHRFHFQQRVSYVGMVKPSKARRLAPALNTAVSFLLCCSLVGVWTKYYSVLTAIVTCLIFNNLHPRDRIYLSFLSRIKFECEYIQSNRKVTQPIHDTCPIYQKIYYLEIRERK
jgi:hypothetical protein